MLTLILLYLYSFPQIQRCLFWFSSFFHGLFTRLAKASLWSHRWFGHRNCRKARTMNSHWWAVHSKSSPSPPTSMTWRKASKVFGIIYHILRSRPCTVTWLQCWGSMAIPSQERTQKTLMRVWWFKQHYLRLFARYCFPILTSIFSIECESKWFVAFASLKYNVYICLYTGHADPGRRICFYPCWKKIG